jgi:RNA polymerase sigma-70 factor (ECF subfamily)
MPGQQSKEGSATLQKYKVSSDQDDKAFFTEQIEAKLDHFFATAMRLTRNRADAEDLVSESITKAWAKFSSLKDRERFVPWVLRIITNTFYSEKRLIANKAQHESYVEEPDDETRFSLFEQLHQPFLLWWGNPEQNFLNELLQDDIAKALDELPENYRIVVILADMEGLTYQEIAQAIDVPVGTVRSRLSRARSQLQKLLWQHAKDRELSATQDQETNQETGHE